MKIELDDGILDHPKFVRAVQIAGSDAFYLWCGLRVYCSKQLTDGLVPDHMVFEVRGPRDRKRRKLALDSLLTSGLLEKRDGGVYLHDYLDWSSSRSQVLAWRAANAERKRKSRDLSRCDKPVTKNKSRRDKGKTEEMSRCDSASRHGGSHSGVPAPSLISDLGSSDLGSQNLNKQEDLPRLPDGKPTGKSDHQSLIDHYHNKFLAVRGAKPVVGGREAKAAKTLLESVGRDLSRAIATIDNAYADQWWRDKVTILDIAGNPSRFITASLPAAKPERWGPGGGNGPQPNDPNNRYKAKGLDY